jgi:hypothetical protein
MAFDRLKSCADFSETLRYMGYDIESFILVCLGYAQALKITKAEAGEVKRELEHRAAMSLCP